ncbi:MAG: gamma-glutamyl-gamma-aminobutyrate hydrolase family protein [Candidatus Abyssubacteria bacterium]
MKIDPVIGISTCMDVGKKIDPERTYQYLEISYAAAVAEAGATPIIIPYLRESTRYEQVLSMIDGLVMSGGEDLPSHVPGETPEVPLALTPECRLEMDRALLEGVLGRGMPFLGICYGMQFLNIRLGGTIYYDIPHQLPGSTQHKPEDAAYRHVVRIQQDTRLRAVLGCEELRVNSSHHQSVRKLGRGLRLAAVCEDGVVEAIEGEDNAFIMGIQWHPEKMADENRRKIFSAFVEACRTA